MFLLFSEGISSVQYWAILKEGKEKKIHNLLCITQYVVYSQYAMYCEIYFSRHLQQFVDCCKQKLFPAICGHQGGPVVAGFHRHFFPFSLSLSCFPSHFCHCQLKGIKMQIRMQPVELAGTILAFIGFVLMLIFICLIKCLFFISTLRLRRRRETVSFYWYSK